MARGLLLSLRHIDTILILLKDMNRYASPMLKVAFDGPDIREESLYDLLRVGFAHSLRNCSL